MTGVDLRLAVHGSMPSSYGPRIARFSSVWHEQVFTGPIHERRLEVRFRCRVWPLSRLRRVLEVSPSGFQTWLVRPASARAIWDEPPVPAIDKSFRASDRAYGARRVWRDVFGDGPACGLHRMERPMRQNATKARPKRLATPNDNGARSLIADNVLHRGYEIDRPNRKWLADLTGAIVARSCRWGDCPSRRRRFERDGRRVETRRRRRSDGNSGKRGDTMGHRWLVHEDGQGRTTGRGRAYFGRVARRQGRRAAQSFRQSMFYGQLCLPA